MPYEVITETAKVYRVRFVHQDGETDRHEYCEAAVRTWPRGGSLSVQSSYGTYANSWNATGDGHFLAFLLRLDFDYFMGKTCPGYMEFDHEKTMAGIRRHIIEGRRGHWSSLTKEEARECWDDLELYGDEHDRSEDLFLSEILRSKALSKFLDADYYGFICHRANPQARGFWDELWPVLCDHWREEIAPPASVESEPVHG